MTSKTTGVTRGGSPLVVIRGDGTEGGEERMRRKRRRRRMKIDADGWLGDIEVSIRGPCGPEKTLPNRKKFTLISFTSTGVENVIPE